MGFSFALHWAQQAHLDILRKRGVPGVGNVLLDFRPVTCLTSRAGHVICIDDGVSLSGTLGLSQDARMAAQRAVESHGLPTHDVVEEVDHTQAVGLRLSQTASHVRPRDIGA